MILVPGTRWASRPVCATRPLSPAPAAAVAVAVAVAVAPVPAVAQSTRPVCAARRPHEPMAFVAAIKWASEPTPVLRLAA